MRLKVTKQSSLPKYRKGEFDIFDGQPNNLQSYGRIFNPHEKRNNIRKNWVRWYRIGNFFNQCFNLSTPIHLNSQKPDNVFVMIVFNWPINYLDTQVGYRPIISH